MNNKKTIIRKIYTKYCHDNFGIPTDIEHTKAPCDWSIPISHLVKCIHYVRLMEEDLK